MNTDIVAVKTVVRIIIIIIAAIADFGLLDYALCDSFDEPWEKILLVVNIVAFSFIICWAWS